MRAPVLAFLAAVVAAAMLALPGSAAARDAFPCGAKSTRTVGTKITTQYCPIYVPARLGHVPVVQFPSGKAAGRLIQGGSVNWFLCQAKGPRASEGKFHNVWWALTLSDDNKRGWVSEVYFRGGANDEADGGLRGCGAADYRWGNAGHAGTPSQSGPPPPPPPPPPCKPYEILGLRGSGEAYAGPYNMGSTVGGAAAVAVSYLPKGSVRAYSIPYPAASAGLVLSDPNTFFTSLDDGAFLLRAEVHRIAARCPRAKIGIIGYSQGAGAASDSVRMMSSADRNRIASLLLFADTYSKGNSRYAYTISYFGNSKPTRAGHGIFGARSIPLAAKKIADVCFDVDPVCVSGDAGTTIVNALFSKVHTEYKSWYAGALLRIFGRHLANGLKGRY